MAEIKNNFYYVLLFSALLDSSIKKNKMTKTNSRFAPLSEERGMDLYSFSLDNVHFVFLIDKRIRSFLLDVGLSPSSSDSGSVMYGSTHFLAFFS